MWLEVDNNDNIVYHLEAEKTLPNDVDMVDKVVIHAYGKEMTDILLTLMSIVNKRVYITIETDIPFDKFTPIIRKYIDEYINTCDNTRKKKSEVFVDVCD